MKQPKKSEAIIRWLEMLRECARGNLARGGISGFHYSGYGDFLLQHGKWYNPIPYPVEMWEGAPRSCYGNAIILACHVPELHFVEGLAEGIENFPVEHAWCTDGENVFDPTWGPKRDMGLAYYGVEFSVERADDATWNGDASILNDYRRRHPLLRQPWTGEDWNKQWPPSPRLRLIRKQLKHAGVYVPACIAMRRESPENEQHTEAERS